MSDAGKSTKRMMNGRARRLRRSARGYVPLTDEEFAAKRTEEGKRMPWTVRRPAPFPDPEPGRCNAKILHGNRRCRSIYLGPDGRCRLHRGREA